MEFNRYDTRHYNVHSAVQENTGGDFLKILRCYRPTPFTLIYFTFFFSLIVS